MKRGLLHAATQFFARAAVVLGIVSIPTAACTAIVDRSATQCRVDADCARFGGHPSCQGGVCVTSGLGPAGCFTGAPQRAGDFLNQCSAAQCFAFDDCQRLDVCGDASQADASLVVPPPPGPVEASTSMPPPASPDSGADAGPPALPSCVDAAQGRGQVVVLTGSSNFPPLLSKLAPLVIAAGYTPVFQVTNSCTGVASVMGAAHLITDPAPGGSGKHAQYFQSDGTAVACSLGAQGAAVDVGESDIFSTTCAGYGAPGGDVAEYLGPVQAMLFVAPGASQQQAISAAAARAVFGMGGDDGVGAPWTNPALYFIRNQNTGTQQMIAKAIGVPPAAFWGVDRGTASAVDADLRVISDPTLANQAIGIISADYYDDDRANLRALAFKAAGQDCAYLPDSTPFKKDKANVRDGHYPIWGPVHFFTAVSNGIPVSPAAAAFVSVVSVPNLAKQLLDAFIASSLVPDCAMTVQRSVELGALSTYSPPFHCGCYFEASVNGSASAGCARCATANDCTDPARPACNLGFCEVQ
jgi:ABC-type phosphate transport system substrate-binding protein